VNTINAGNSKRTSAGSIGIGWMIAESPNAARILKTLLPTMAPMTRSVCPRKPATIDVASSGSDVPMATSVTPMMNSDSPTERAIETAPPTRS
jgi:hypothetical protein